MRGEDSKIESQMVTRHVQIYFCPDIIIVILTSFDLPEYRQAARESMADYFVLKGSSIKDFQRNTRKTGTMSLSEYRAERHFRGYWNP